MGPRYLLDANAVIDYVGNKLPESAALAMDKLIDEELITSIVVRIEVLGFNGLPADMSELSAFLAIADLFYIDDIIAEKTIELRKNYRKLKLGDALIEATALVHGLTIVSRNTKDFQNIAGLTCVNPYDFQ